ncbi:FxsA family protein [Actinokineospora soli]|uniref:FxsA family protein n=1 Tax=Actinokineospora soli TaxID=1048753 RepID=A0ABW2TTE5_9PSEU
MPVLVLLLLAVAAEVAVLVWIGGLVGLLPTILLLIGATLLGGWLLRREGARAMGALQQAVFARRAPDREVVDGVLVAAAGVLVFLPGLISDALALALLFPPTRALVRKRLLRAAARRAGVVDSFVVDSQRVEPTVIVIPQPRDDTKA